MSKYQIIDKCWQCYRIGQVCIDGKMKYWCSKEDREVKDRFTIPGWCKLGDVFDSEDTANQDLAV